MSRQTQVGCVVNVYEGNQRGSNPSSSIPTCTIEVHIRLRYRLKFPSADNKFLCVIEDVEAPEHCTSFRIPIILPLPMWRELYLDDIVKPLNLDACVRNLLNQKIADAAVLLAERHKNKGFGMVAKVGILKVELMSKEETDRILRQIGCQHGQ